MTTTSSTLVVRPRTLLGRLTGVLLVAAMLTAGLVSAPAQAQPVATGAVAAAVTAGDGGSDAAARWLAEQLVAGGYKLPSPWDATMTDWGLTIDALFALASAGVAGDVAQQTAAQIAAHGHDYTQWGDVGSIAKTALALQVAGLPATLPTGNGTQDLIAELRASLTGTGQFDGASGFGQSLAILALARTPEGVPASAVTYLLGYQCTTVGNANEGGFGYGTGASACSGVDTDYTGMALSALIAAGYDANDAVVQKTLTWLTNNQNADGSFAASWNPGVGNGNSTGLAGQAARQIGTPAAVQIATKAAGFVESLQVTCSSPYAEGTNPATGGGFVYTWHGALAYTQESYDTAVAEGIEPVDVDQWRRNTAQALLTLGAAPGFSQLTLAGADPAIPDYPACAPLPTAPAAPVKPGISATGSSITVTWTEPANGHSQITGYEITLTPAGGGAPISDTAGSSATSLTFTSVPSGTWSATVVASNEVGESPASPASNTVTVPRGPQIVTTTTTASGARVTYGKAGSIAVTVSGGATGRVSTTVAGKTITATLTGGKATLALPARSLAPGNRTLTITYPGVSGQFTASSTTVTVPVAKAVPTVKVTPSKATKKKVMRGKTATYTVTVTAPKGIKVSGKVTVKVAGKSKTVKLNAKGKATVKITIPKKTKPGKLKVTTSYAGNTYLTTAKAKTFTTKVTK